MLQPVDRRIAASLLAVIATATLLYAGRDSAPKAPVADAAMDNVLGVRGEPLLDDAPDLAGIDANGNGVRDDIERIILNAPLSERHRLATMRLAKALQEVMAEPPLDREAARRRGRQTLDAAICLASLGAPLHSLGTELETYTFNTPARRSVALATRQNLDTTGLTEKGEWHCL